MYYYESLFRISPSAKSRLLCFTPVFIWDAFIAGWAFYCTEEPREKKRTTPVCGFVSHCLVSSNPSLSLLIASLRCVHSDASGSIFVSISCWITGATHKTIWHDALFKIGVSLWCRSPLPALIFAALYSPVPDGRLKSIFLPTEMCCPEHYIKPWSGVQSGAGGTELPARWHCCLTKKKARRRDVRRGEKKKKRKRLHVMIKNWWKT